MGLAETQEAIDAAAAAFPAWSRTTAKVNVNAFLPPYFAQRVLLQQRHDILIRLFQLMQQHHEDLGRLIVRAVSTYLTLYS